MHNMNTILKWCIDHILYPFECIRFEDYKEKKKGSKNKQKYSKELKS